MKFFIFFFVSFFFAAASAADADHIQQKRGVISAMGPLPDKLAVELLDDDELASESIMRKVLVDEPILQNNKVIEQQFLIDQNIRWQELENQRFLRRQMNPYNVEQYPMMRNYMERQYMPMRNRLNMQLLNMDMPYMPLEMRQPRISPLYYNQMIREMHMRNPKWETLYNYPRSYSWVPEPNKQIMTSY